MEKPLKDGIINSQKGQSNCKGKEKEEQAKEFVSFFCLTENGDKMVMDYESAKRWLKEIEKYGSLLGLKTMKELALRLGNPQQDLDFVHIAGTNGKGSVLSYINSIFKESGYKVGAYISPTVFSYREKIQISGQYIGRKDFALLAGRVRKAAEQMAEEGLSHPTVFEAETMLALLYFKEKGCDMVLLECGLGGLTDATNIIENTKVAVFTPISLDHMAFLGDSVEEIAEIKAGIIKEKARTVSGIQKQSVSLILEQAAKALGCDFIGLKEKDIVPEEYDLSGNTFTYKGKTYKTSLIGDYQIENASLAIEAVRQLQKDFPKITETSIKEGIRRAEWQGRFSLIEKNPYLLIDGAHNRAGAERLVSSLKKYFPQKKCIFVCGMFSDKEYDKILETVAPLAKELIAVQTKNHPRALSASHLAEEAKKYCKKVFCNPDVLSALAMAKEHRGEDLETVIVVCGSLSFLHEIVKGQELRGQPCKDKAF